MGYIGRWKKKTMDRCKILERLWPLYHAIYERDKDRALYMIRAGEFTDISGLSSYTNAYFQELLRALYDNDWGKASEALLKIIYMPEGYEPF